MDTIRGKTCDGWAIPCADSENTQSCVGVQNWWFDMKLEAKIVKHLNSMENVFAFKVRQSAGSYRGIADIIAVVDGVPLAIEVKKGSDRLSRLQTEFLNSWHEAGGEYCIANRLEDALNAVETIRRDG